MTMMDQCSASNSLVSLLPFELLLIIANMLDNDTILSLLQVFQTLPHFAPFLCLLKLNSVEGVFKVWPLHITDQLLNTHDCALVNETSYLTRSVEFYGQLDAITTIKTCNILNASKVSLILDGFEEFELSNESVQDLISLRIYKLELANLNLEDGCDIVSALSQNTNLRVLKLDSISLCTKCRIESFISIEKLKKLDSFAWCCGENFSLSLEDCQTLGDSLQYTNITRLEVCCLGWDGLVELVERLKLTQVTSLRVYGFSRGCFDEYSDDLAKMLLGHLAESKVAKLSILFSALPDSFAALALSAENLKFNSLELELEEFTLAGITKLVQMNLEKLILVDMFSTITPAMMVTLRHHKSPGLDLVIRYNKAVRF